MGTKYQMLEYVTDYEASKILSELGIDHSFSFKWVRIGDQEPILVFRKWIDEHKAFLKDVVEYNAYSMHELIDILGERFASLQRSNAGYIAFAFTPSKGYIENHIETKRPQDALAGLLISIKKNDNANKVTK